MITRFSAERHTRTRIREKDGVQPVLASLCPDARNTHIAFRIEGTFRTITVRTAEGQCYPGEGLKVGRNMKAFLSLSFFFVLFFSYTSPSSLGK